MIVWIGRTTVRATGPLASITIRANALVNSRDLRVSPQHRMMLDGWRVELHCETNEVFAPAKALLNDHTIYQIEGGHVTYIHIAFAQHQIVCAEGIASESFFPGAQALTALARATCDEILTLFPQWRSPEHRLHTARPTISARIAKTLI